MIGPERQLTQLFLTLPFRHQIAVAMSLNVLTEDDRASSDDALFLELFKRATSRGLLGKLWAETVKHHKNHGLTGNPFEPLSSAWVWSTPDNEADTVYGSTQDGWSAWVALLVGRVPWSSSVTFHASPTDATGVTFVDTYPTRLEGMAAAERKRTHAQYQESAPQS